jgi:ABC-2 type transport system permease protein
MFPVVFMSTAFVPAELMPGWMQSVNDYNPVTYQIEAIRALMTQGFDWSAIGSALLADAVVGAVLLTGTLWAFRRLAK